MTDATVTAPEATWTWSSLVKSVWTTVYGWVAGLLGSAPVQAGVASVPMWGKAAILVMIGAYFGDEIATKMHGWGVPFKKSSAAAVELPMNLVKSDDVKALSDRIATLAKSVDETKGLLDGLNLKVGNIDTVLNHQADIASDGEPAPRKKAKPAAKPIEFFQMPKPFGP